MESCSGAHHVARRLRLIGLVARLVAGHFVTPYRMAGKSGKNDANDAAALCEAAGRPQMRFVPVKTADQQGHLAVRRLRDGMDSPAHFGIQVPAGDAWCRCRRMT
jgi:transposase